MDIGLRAGEERRALDLTALLSCLRDVKRSGTGYSAKCPAHDDRHNSLSITQAERRILLHCHAGCSFDAVTSALHITSRELVMAEPSPVTTSLRRKSEAVYVYHDADGSPLFEVHRYRHADGSKTFRQRRRTEDGRVAWNMRGVTPVLYRLPHVLEAARRGGTVYLCEGEKDVEALLAAEPALCATTSPMGAGKWRDRYADALRGAVEVILLPDNDESGCRHMEHAAASLARAGVPVRIADLAAVWDGLPAKGDVSDLLAHGGIQLFEACVQAARPPETSPEALEGPNEPLNGELVVDYLKPSTGGFWGDLGRQTMGQAVETGFPSLDKQLEGRLYPGLYVLGALSSLGKTAFCGQLADRIAEQGREVLFFTLEMARYEMVARSLARTLFQENARTEREAGVGSILYGDVPRGRVEEAAAAYAARSGGKLRYVEGNMGYDADALCDCVRAHAKASPVVFLDYLQALSAPGLHYSDRQAMDYNVFALKRLSRELEIPVIAVSSFNRQSYQEDVSFASFKESGAIEYSADFVFALQAAGVGDESLNGIEERRLARAVSRITRESLTKDPRPVELVTLKNRRGPAYARFRLDFYARQYCFVESW